MLFVGQHHVADRRNEQTSEHRHHYLLPIAILALVITLFFAHAAAMPKDTAGTEFGGFTMKNTSLAYGQGR